MRKLSMTFTTNYITVIIVLRSPTECWILYSSYQSLCASLTFLNMSLCRTQRTFHHLPTRTIHWEVWSLSSEHQSLFLQSTICTAERRADRRRWFGLAGWQQGSQDTERVFNGCGTIIRVEVLSLTSSNQRCV